jgi:hypothetical protein
VKELPLPHRSRTVRAVLLAGSAALVSATLAAAPATASAPTTAVTVLLKAPDPAGLDRLAMTTGLSYDQRMHALSALLPSASVRNEVAQTLESEGFSVGHETAWTIDATAAQPTVTTLFGANVAASGTDHVARTGALPAVPEALSGLVAAVLPSSATPTLFHPQISCSHCRNGEDFRDAYTSVDTTPPSGLGSAGAKSVTIATLQFAPWNNTDLEKYAANTSAPLGDPLTNGQYTEINTGSKAISPATGGENGADEEADLDQESILSTDPYAKQRAYFNTDTTKGYVDNLAQVLADVTQGKGAVSGGDPHIVALSTSWGSCESEFKYNFPGDTLAAVNNLLSSLTAAGVTVFAATGDDGVYDCGDSKTSTKIAVDYPASSPRVVAVGGTKLSAPGGRVPNTGSNWSESAWTCTGPLSCEGPDGSGGSGGGESRYFALPAYQREGIGSQPFKTSTHKTGNFGTQPHRLLPDIAADGDPTTGFLTLTSDPVEACTAEYASYGSLGGPLIKACEKGNNSSGFTVSLPIGGTSLSSPVSAALFTNLLSTRGLTHGVGDIHPALYAAYANEGDGAFRDVTSGRNGKQSDVDNHAHGRTAAELPVSAQKGYDTVSGLGAALWPKIGGYVFNPKAPRATVSIRLATPHSTKHKDRIRVTWGFHQLRTNGMLGGSARVEISRVGRSKPVWRKARAAATGSYSFTGAAGATYSAVVTPTSLTGQVGGPVGKVLTVPYDDGRFVLSGVWVRRSGGFGGSLLTTTVRGATATTTASATTYAAGVRTGPGYGILEVLKHGTKVATLDLYSRRPGYKIVTFFGSPEASRAKRTFTFVSTGRHSSAATGRTVDVDALYAEQA